MPRVEKFDKGKAIENALNLFWEKGYEATSLADLTNELGIGKGSFYNTFKSKRAMFEQCLNLYRANSIHSLKEILSTEKDIKKGVKYFLIFNLNAGFEQSKHRGCFVTNTCTELTPSDNKVKQTISAHYQLMREILIEYLNKQGKLRLKDARLIADVIITFFIGLTVQFKLQIVEKQVVSSVDKMLQSLF